MLELEQIEWLVYAVCGLVIILFIMVLTFDRKINKYMKVHRQLIGESSAAELEELLVHMQNKISTQQDGLEEQGKTIEKLQHKLRRMKGNVAVERYNAFGLDGNDLSFSIAIMDDEQNGVLLTGIHNRDETYVYAKPVKDGQSSYSLSPEEKQVIQHAGNKAKS